MDAANWNKRIAAIIFAGVAVGGIVIAFIQPSISMAIQGILGFVFAYKVWTLNP